MKQIKLSQFIVFLSIILCIGALPFLNFSFSESSITLNLQQILSDYKDKHIARLYQLTLSGGSSSVVLEIADNSKQLNLTNGIVVGSGSRSESDLSSVGGGIDNAIKPNSNHAGIAGGTKNSIQGENSVIGGGSGNTVNGANGVVAGGQGNTATRLGVVAGGKNNTASGNGVALGGQGNNAGDNSLVMGSGAGGTRAFARNAVAEDYAARIDAKSGVLIGTTQSIQGVNLVVSGAVKIQGNNDTDGVAGEIKVVSGCFYAYDGKYWHVISQTDNPENCTGFVSTESCEFGNVRLQQGDQVTGYQNTVDSQCKGEKVVCSGGALLTTNGGATGFDKPYCHKIG